jgi:hypothetical protein
MHSQDRFQSSCRLDRKRILSKRPRAHAISHIFPQSRETIQGLHPTACGPARNEEADALAKAAAKGEALPSDVFYHVIGTLAVRNPEGLQITNDAEGHRIVNLIMTEDWWALIILYLQGHYHPSDINEAKRLKH